MTDADYEKGWRKKNQICVGKDFSKLAFQLEVVIKLGTKLRICSVCNQRHNVSMLGALQVKLC